MKNKNIIKALAIGISASMALQPVTAFAEDNTVPSNEGMQAQNDEQNAQQVFDTAAENIQYAGDALVSEAPVESIVTENTSVDSAKTETENEKELVSDVPGIDTTDKGPVAQLGAASDALTEAGGNIEAAENAVEAAKAADKAVSDFAASEVAQDAKDAIIGEDGAAQIAKEGLDHTVDVDEFANTDKANAVYDAGQAVSNLGDAKSNAEDASDKYQSAIDGAQAYDPSADTTGELLEQIKKDAAAADTSLEKAEADLEQAQNSLTKAQTEYDEADYALKIAETALGDAQKAYDNLFITDENGNRIEKTQKQIDLARAALDVAQSDFTAAKEARDAASASVREKVNDLSSAKYAELLALKNAADAAEGDEAKQATQKAFQEALIKYHFIGDDTANLESISFGETAFAGLDRGNVVTVDGVDKYVTGYEKEFDAEGNETGRYAKDADGNYIPILATLPSVVSVTYKMKGDETATVKRYSITPKDNGRFDITELTEEVTPSEITEPVEITTPAHYEKDGETVAITEADTVVDVNDENGNKTGAYVTTVNDENKIYEYKVDQVPADTETVRYVKNNDESGKTKTPTYKSEMVKTDEVIGYETEAYDEVNPGDGDTYDAVKEAAKAHKEAGNYVKTQAKNLIYGSLTSWLLGLPEWIDIEANDGYVGIVGEFAKFIDRDIAQEILGNEVCFRVVYKTASEKEGAPIYGEEEKSGIVVETYDTYDKEVWGVAGTTPKDYTDRWGDTVYFEHKGWAQSTARHLEKNGYKNVQIKSETYYGSQYFYITYDVDKYDWVKTNEKVTVTTSKNMYQANQYTYVAESTTSAPKTVGTVYALRYKAGQASTLNDAKDNGYALQQKYNDALAQFEATNKAYENAQAALNRAKDSVDDLEKNKATGKKAFVDAENAYKAAVAAVEQARLDRETARKVLEETDWEDLFIKAQEAIEIATGKKKDSDDAVNKADQAKKDYDNRPAVTPGTPSDDNGTTDGTPSDDNGTTGGTSSDASDDTSDDTTITPVAISTVAANAQAGEGEAVLGERRTPASRAAAASAKSNGSKVTGADSTSSTNNSSNSAVAGDTNSNATEKETDTVDTTTTIEEEETAKAATPIETQKSFPYWVLIILAAIAGLSVEEYVRRRNEKVKADDSKKN